MKISITLNRIFKPISILVTDFFLQKATKTPFIPIHHDPVHNHPAHFSLPFQVLFPSFNTNKKANVSETHVHTDLWTKSPPPSYRHWKRGKVYPCLQNNRNARNRCPSTPVNRRGNRGRGRGELALFPNAACSYIRICLETVVYPVRQKNTRGGPCPGRSSMSDRYVAWGGGAGFRSKPVREYKKLQDAYPNGGRLMVPTESPIRVG